MAVQEEAQVVRQERVASMAVHVEVPVLLDVLVRTTLVRMIVFVFNLQIPAEQRLRLFAWQAIALALERYVQIWVGTADVPGRLQTSLILILALKMRSR